MANEIIGARVGAGAAAPYAAIPLGLAANLPAAPHTGSPVAGFRMPRGRNTSYYFLHRIPNAAALGTGITVELVIAVDPNSNNADTGGTKGYFGVVAGPITSGTSTLDNSDLASSTEVKAQTAALGTAPGVATVLSIAIPVADLNSAAAGSTLLVRVTRYGTNASDTNLGQLILVNVDVRNT